MAVVQEECDQVTQEIEKNVKFRSLRETIREMHQQVCDQVTQAMEKNEKFRLRETIREMYQQVCDQVTQEMEKNTKLKPVLSFLQATLNSLRSDEIFQGLQIFNDQYKMIMKFMALYLDEGVKLLAEVSKLRLWDYYFWLDSYTDRLVHLDLVLMIFQRWMRTPPNNKFETVPLKAEVQLGREQVAAQAAFQRLFEAVIEGEEKDVPFMISRLFSDIKNKIEMPNQPMVEWRDHESKMWNYWYLVLIHNKPTEEVRSFREEMDKGLEVVRRSCGVGELWQGYTKTKYDCITGLLGLNDYLQRHMYDAI